MNAIFQTAIELKYKGYSYQEIVRNITKIHKMHLSETTLRTYFSVDGKLYIPYLEYEARMNEWNEEHSKAEHKRMSAYTARVRSSLLKKAIKEGDYRLALDIIKDIDDRAGNVVVRKSQVNVTEEQQKPMSHEEFVKELARLHINPRTGLRMGTAKMEQN